MSLMQVVSVTVPSEALPYERIDPEIIVKNNSSKSQQVLVWAVWFVGTQQVNAQMNPHPSTISAGASQEFTLPAVMPNHDITMGFWVQVWQLNGQPPPNDFYEWITDTYTERDIKVESALSEWKQVDRATSSVLITTVPSVTGWREVYRDIASIALGSGGGTPVTYKCPYCGMVFDTPSELSEHIMQVHPDEDDDEEEEDTLKKYLPAVLVAAGAGLVLFSLPQGDKNEK